MNWQARKVICQIRWRRGQEEIRSLPVVRPTLDCRVKGNAPWDWENEGLKSNPGPEPRGYAVPIAYAWAVRRANCSCERRPSLRSRRKNSSPACHDLVASRPGVD